MEAKINVTFEMNFTADKDGKIGTSVTFSLPDYPHIKCPEALKKPAMEEVQMLVTEILKRPDEAFSA